MRTQVQPGQIAKIHGHLKDGNEIICATYGRIEIMDKRHVEYIRTDGKGYRLGWPGKKGVFCFAENLFFIAPGYTMKQKRRRA